jgi:ATP-dependent DNA helicase RecG
MLPKGKSVTKLSKSSTSNSGIETPIQFVKGVGPRLAQVFGSRGMSTIRDLLYFFPRAYEDRSKLTKVADLVEGETATVQVSVISVRNIPIRMGRTILEVRCEDDTGPVSLKWFHTPRGMENSFKMGAELSVTGTPKFFMGKVDLVHPEITWGQAKDYNTGRVVPIYVEIEGIPTRTLRKILWEAVENFSQYLRDDLPQSLRDKHGLPKLSDAVRFIHFPPEGTEDTQALVGFRTPYHSRLIYDEFFKFEYLILKRRLRMQREAAVPYEKKKTISDANSLEKHLPFELTGDQRTSVSEILEDLSLPTPMNRLMQGDVGSGKTAVAFLSAGSILAQGGQCALMVPTEILAEQHYQNAIRIFSGKLNVALLTGSTSNADRALLHSRLEKGEPLLLIGTHALIEEPVQFKGLDLVMIDEQHRFGVEQRRALRMKGARMNGNNPNIVYPHTLILTATPIPRTLALTAYGDLAVSTLKEMPKGRIPILTKIVSNKNDLHSAYQRIREELKNGRQIYFIYPLVNESEAEGFTHYKAAVAEFEVLSKEVFPDFKVGLLHGQMKGEEKNQIMNRFKSGEIQVLVSTTVVEVGVDVPNATVLVIEHSERFGLSQLHQLRGRVGRGSDQSYCFLFTHQKSGEISKMRLDVLENSTDGFKIAEADLEIRGPGEFLGTRQAGGLPFRLANLIRDQKWLLQARDDVLEILRHDPDLLTPELSPLRRYFESEGKLHLERLKTS